MNNQLISIVRRDLKKQALFNAGTGVHTGMGQSAPKMNIKPNTAPNTVNPQPIKPQQPAQPIVPPGTNLSQPSNLGNRVAVPPPSFGPSPITPPTAFQPLGSNSMPPIVQTPPTPAPASNQGQANTNPEPYNRPTPPVPFNIPKPTPSSYNFPPQEQASQGLSYNFPVDLPMPKGPPPGATLKELNDYYSQGAPTRTPSPTPTPSTPPQDQGVNNWSTGNEPTEFFNGEPVPSDPAAFSTNDPSSYDFPPQEPPLPASVVEHINSQLGNEPSSYNFPPQQEVNTPNMPVAPKPERKLVGQTGNTKTYLENGRYVSERTPDATPSVTPEQLANQQQFQQEASTPAQLDPAVIEGMMAKLKPQIAEQSALASQSAQGSPEALLHQATLDRLNALAEKGNQGSLNTGDFKDPFAPTPQEQEQERRMLERMKYRGGL